MRWLLKNLACAWALFLCFYTMWQIWTCGGVTWAGKVAGGVTFTRQINPVGYWVSLGLYAAFVVALAVIANSDGVEDVFTKETGVLD